MIVTAELDTFMRNTFSVKAVLVTSDNVREISQWVGGDYVWPEKGAPYVRIPCGAKKDNCRAYIGDWVTSLVGGKEPNFRVYKKDTFSQAFQKIEGKAENYVKIHDLLMKIRSAQDVATYYGEAHDGVLLLVEKTARQICEMM